MSSALSQLPKVDRVLEHPRLAELDWRRAMLRRLVNEAIAAERERVLAALAQQADPGEVVGASAMAERVRARVDAWASPHPRRVLNGTGVLLHTNLGRAPLPASVRAAVAEAAGTCDLELELATGKRGSRLAVLRPLLAALFEAEDVHVVNNGAAALLLACTALGRPGGVALSRGQHVEIGDSFRVADMAAAGGAPLIAVGSTNRTHLRDYGAALDGAEGGPGASALLWVHRSNFVQEGFVGEVSLSRLAGLAEERGVPLIADLGSGSLGAGLPADEPTVAAYLRAGASLVGFSGDKLLGGPQAGLLAGSAELIARCRRHPLARALRLDKLGVAALHATALAHARGQEAGPDLPLHRMYALSVDELRARAERLRAALGWSASCVRESAATLGGGALPGSEIASVALVPELSAVEAASARLRGQDPPLVARIHEGELWIDLRTLADVDDEELLACLRELPVRT